MSTKLISKLNIVNGLVQATGNLTVDSTANGQSIIRDAGALVFRALVAADVSGTLTTTTGDARYQLLTGKGVANGYAPLDAGNLIPTAHLPPLAITNTFVAANQAAMLALTAEVGDVCVRTDLSKTFILQTSPASVLANWVELATPPDAVLSVNGQTGVVNLTQANISGTQPLDGDLTALAASSGTNTIYYRSGVDTWSAVTFSGLSFAGGVLTVTGTGLITSVADTSTVDLTVASGVLTAATIGFTGTFGD